MDHIFFSIKRAHHAALKVTRPLLASCGLTPARFDLLYVVADACRITQSALRKVLGVARATISEMLASLEQTGLITRERDIDKRTWCVELTEKARDAITRATRIGIDSGYVPLLIDAGIERLHDEGNIFERDQLDGTLLCLRRSLGDRPQENPFEWDLDFIEWAIRDWPDNEEHWEVQRN